MNKASMSKLTPTPGQTVGPFYGYALPYTKDRELQLLDQYHAEDTTGSSPDKATRA